MQKKIRFAIITIIAILAGLFAVQATSNAQTVTVSPSKTIYTFNGNKTMYRYYDSAGNYQNLFCYDYGGALNDGTVYTVTANLYSLTDEQITLLFGSKENYNKTLWIVDNMYISDGQTKEEKDVMIYKLKQSLHSDVAINAVRATHNVPNFNSNDMDAVINHIYNNGWENVFYSIEQCAIWNYTNNTKSFPGLTSLNGGYDLEGKYYMWMYTGLKAVADTKGNYKSPNISNGVSNTMTNLSMDSKNAVVDANNKKIGPFIVNGYNSELLTKNSYTVKINGTQLPSSDYETSFDGKSLYITIKSTKYDINSAVVNISMNLKTINTTATFLYRNESQDVMAFHKNVVSKSLSGTTDSSKFDLRLIKNIAGVWSVSDSTAQVKYDLNSKELATRNIERVSSLKNGSTTESWKINKYPVSVATGDIIKYQITIANEGDLNGYATQIKDYIAEGLELVNREELISLGIIGNDDEYYGWSKGDKVNGFTELSTQYLSDKEIKAYDATTDTVDTKIIYVYCRVTATQVNELLKNVAEISADRTVNGLGSDVNDRDSTPGNVDKSKLSNAWNGNSANVNIIDTDISKQYFYPGEEDDDDFDTVQIQNFDLALTKQITDIEYPNGTQTSLTRLSRINKENLVSNKETTASYIMSKKPVSVSKDCIVTYKISVYNEGNVDGYAKEITDYLPAGLEFYSSDVSGENYNWEVTKNPDGTTTIKTQYLSDTKIPARDGNLMNSNYVEVRCIISSEEENKILTNVAEITKYGYYSGNTLIEANVQKIDIDSVQNSLPSDTKTKISQYEEKTENTSARAFDKAITNYQDDDDYEKVEIVKSELDLALRKSITAINGNALEPNRYPKVSAVSASAALATGNAEYYHNKEYIKANIGDEITYTIRVFNEGNYNDYSGYAKVITDFLPDGIEFVKIADSTSTVWKTTSKPGDKKVVLTYNSNKAIPSASLLDIYKELSPGKNIEDDSDNYQNVSIICKVVGSGEKLTNRAEITSEVATDKEGNIIENINDRDSTPGSLNENNIWLASYYDYYNRAYGIDDTYHSYYYGEENGRIEDDVDFETISVEPIYGKVGIFKYEDTNKNGKYDSEDKVLKGAKFALKDNLESDEYVTKELETDENGKVVFEGLELNKTYYIVETYAPVRIQTITKCNPNCFKTSRGRF